MLGPGDGGRQPVLPAEWWGPMAHAVFGQDSAGLVALDAQLRVLATNVVPAAFPRLAAVEVGTRVAELLEALGVPDLYPMVERVLRAERGTVDRAYSVKGRGVDGG
ncbi:MAG: hypothetical protein HOV68_03655, partial [Streptomycetaceae bacterium]|nr:hypothetical protein [Streptomycetaceae bacterium]